MIDAIDVFGWPNRWISFGLCDGPDELRGVLRAFTRLCRSSRQVATKLSPMTRRKTMRNDMSDALQLARVDQSNEAQ